MIHARGLAFLMTYHEAIVATGTTHTPAQSFSAQGFHSRLLPALVLVVVLVPCHTITSLLEHAVQPSDVL